MMSEHSRIRRVTLFAGALSIAGCQHAAAVEPGAAASPPVHVDSAEVATVQAPVILHLTGTLRGAKETDLASNAAGLVVRTFVERGDEVKPGMVVAQLDTSAAALSLRQAQVDVDTSQTQDAINRADCLRYQQLYSRGVISALEYDQSVAKCKTAPLGLLASQARERIAAKNVGDGSIRAPFAGIVVERFVDVGEYVQPSSRVLSLVQNGDLRLELAIPEANLADVKVGADVTFSVAAYPDQVFRGQLRFLSGGVRAATRDLIAEAVVPNQDRRLRPGMFAAVSLETGTRPLPAVPSAAVFERQDKKRVYVIADRRLEERVLQYGPEVDGRLSVEQGVKQGEKVAIGDLSQLMNGQSVD